MGGFQLARRIWTLHASPAGASSSYSTKPDARPGSVQMPTMIYGTAWKTERTCDLVLQALRLGFRGIDTACQPKHYNEPAVGEALEASGLKRQDIYLQTKFTPLSGQDPQRVPYDADAALEVQVEQSVAASLKNLRTTWVDCLVLHSPLASHADTLRAWRAMEVEVSRGRCRSLGISNCHDPKQFELLYGEARIKPAVLQNRFYADTGYDASLRRFCRERGIVYQSFWTLTANPSALRSRPLKRVARAHGCSSEAAWFGFVRGIGIVPLSGTSSEAHMAADLALPTLTEDEVRLLDEVLLQAS